MSHLDEHGMATAEFCVGTLGAAMIGVVLYRLGMLDDNNPWIDSLREILERSLGWGTLRSLFDHIPRYGLKIL